MSTWDGYLLSILNTGRLDKCIFYEFHNWLEVFEHKPLMYSQLPSTVCLVENRSTLVNPGDFFQFGDLVYLVSIGPEDSWIMQFCDRDKLDDFRNKINEALTTDCNILQPLCKIILDYHCSQWSHADFLFRYKTIVNLDDVSLLMLREYDWDTLQQCSEQAQHLESTCYTLTADRKRLLDMGYIKRYCGIKS